MIKRSNHLFKHHIISVFIILLLLQLTLDLFCQEITASAGDFFANDNQSISFSLGEIVTETFTESNMILTQGFQQSNLTITSVDPAISSENISLFPNPVINSMKLNITGEIANMEFKLHNMEGKLLIRKEISDRVTYINFEDYPSGGYLLNIIQNNTLVKSFHISKSN